MRSFDKAALQSSTKSLPAHILDPVIALRMAPVGTLYRLDDFQRGQKPANQLTIGRAKSCDIVLEDPYVSQYHCVVHRDGARVFAEALSSKNALLINGAPVRSGSIELLSGHVLTVGLSALVACGQAGMEQDIYIIAPNLDEFLRKAVRFYGSKYQAAGRLGLPNSTLGDWLRKARFRKGLER